jgi:O-antigen/teichoic acid export membrane protein
LDLSATALVTGRDVAGDARIRPAEKAAIWLKALVAAAALGIFAITGEWLGRRFLHAPGGRGFFLALAAAGAGLLILRSAQLYFQVRLRFRFYGFTDGAHAGLRIVLAGWILLGKSPSPVAVLASLAAAAGIVVAICLVFAGKAAWAGAHAGREDFRAVLGAAASPLATFSVSSVVSRLDMFFVALRATPAALGLYSSALTLATIPEILGAYVAPALLPRILPACKDGSFPALFRRVHAWIAAAAAAACMAAAIAWKPVFGGLLPPRYRAASRLVIILLPGTLAAASYFPLTLNFLMLRRSQVFLIVDTLAAPVLIAGYYFLAPVQGVAAAAWITTLHRLVKAAAAQTAAARMSRATIDS